MASTDCSPQPLEPILMVVNGCSMEVWLRRNIQQETDEDGNEVWMADAVHGILPANTTGAYVSENFDALWDEWDDTPMHVRVADVRETADENTGAIVELATITAETEVTIDNLAGAIVELATIVAGGDE